MDIGTRAGPGHGQVGWHQRGRHGLLHLSVPVGEQQEVPQTCTTSRASGPGAFPLSNQVAPCWVASSLNSRLGNGALD